MLSAIAVLSRVDRRTAVVLDGRHNGCGRIGHDLRNNACERVIGRFNGRADVSTAAACCGCCGLVGHDTASHSGNGERDVIRNGLKPVKQACEAAADPVRERGQRTVHLRRRDDVSDLIITGVEFIRDCVSDAGHGFQDGRLRSLHTFTDAVADIQADFVTEQPRRGVNTQRGFCSAEKAACEAGNLVLQPAPTGADTVGNTVTDIAADAGPALILNRIFDAAPCAGRGRFDAIPCAGQRGLDIAPCGRCSGFHAVPCAGSRSLHAVPSGRRGRFDIAPSAGQCSFLRRSRRWRYSP